MSESRPRTRTPAGAHPCRRVERRARRRLPGHAHPHRGGALSLGTAATAGLLALGLLAAGTGPAPAQFEAKPPEGFEDLDAPQSSLVDLYFRGELLGQYLASYAPGWVAFERPEQVVADLPGVAEPDALRRALTGRLDSNAQRICEPGEEDCGYVETDTAAVIFDRARFRVDLFVDPDLLEAPDLGPDYLGAPAAAPSFVQSFAAAGSTQVGDTAAGSASRGTIRSFTLFGFGAGRVRADTSLSNRDGVALDVLAGELDRGGLSYRGGLFRASPLPSIGQRRVLGAGIETTLDLRTDIEAASGTPLVVTLQRRAVVEILRDGRVLDSQVYPPGTQRLDTAGLPRGAYDVTLRIDQVGGGVRTQQRFFVKDRLIPPSDQPSYTLNVGRLAEDASPGLPDLGAPVLHAGHRRRVLQNFGVGLDLAATDREAAAEGALFYRGSLGRLQLSGFASSARDYGLALRGFGNAESYSYAVQLRRVWSGRARRGTVTGDEVQELVPPRLDGTTLDLTIDYLLPDGGRLGIAADVSRRADGETRYSAGPQLRIPLLERAAFDLSFQAEAAIGKEESLAFASLRLTWSGPDTLASAVTGYRFARGGQRDSTPYASVQGSVAAVDTPRRQINLGAGANLGLDESVRADAAYFGPDTRADLGVERSLTDARETRAFGTLATTVVGDPEGVALMGDDSNRSAVVVQVDGDTDTRFRILVDDRPVGRVAAGERVSLPLQPYERYRVRLRRIAGRFVDYDTSPRRITVFPGTVHTLDWQVAPVVSVFAQAVRPNGTPVADALIEGTDAQLRTDRRGYFQVDVGTQDKLVLRPRDGAPCRIPLPDLTRDTEFRDLGSLTCKEIAQ